MNRSLACRALFLGLGAVLIGACAESTTVGPSPLETGGTTDPTGSGGSVTASGGNGGTSDPTGTGGSGPSPSGGTGGSGGSSDSNIDSGNPGLIDSGSMADAIADHATTGNSDSGVADPGTQGDGVREIGPSYADAPEIKSVAGVPKGKIIRFTIAGNSSKIFPKAPNRPVTVYIPSQYMTGTPAPVIVVQDGDNFFDFVSLLSNTLDNLINAKKLPPIVAVFANNGGGDAQGSERGLEYDTVSGVYAQWCDQELLPRAEMETKTQVPAQAVTFTHDPEGRGALGGSSGGVASFSMLWWHPDLFRRSVTYSASLVAQESPINPDHPFGAWNYHDEHEMDDGGIISMTSPNKPIRPWLECGSADNDKGAIGPGGQYPHYDFEYANQRTELKLATKGYHVHLDHAAGATHVDGRVVRQTLPEAMLWAWRGYPIK